DGLVERLLVGARRRGEPAHLPDVLERCVAHLARGGRRLVVEERSYVPAHAPTLVPGRSGAGGGHATTSPPLSTVFTWFSSSSRCWRPWRPPLTASVTATASSLSHSALM